MLLGMKNQGIGMYICTCTSSMKDNKMESKALPLLLLEVMRHQLCCADSCCPCFQQPHYTSLHYLKRETDVDVLCMLHTVHVQKVLSGLSKTTFTPGTAYMYMHFCTCTFTLHILFLNISDQHLRISILS